MNQTNHYISTYQKDYTWPYVSSICRTQPSIKPIIKDCTCTNLWQVYKQDGKLKDCLKWSQMDSMGQLLEPKIYPKIEQIPELDIMRFDQLPSICVR